MSLLIRMTRISKKDIMSPDALTVTIQGNKLFI